VTNSCAQGLLAFEQVLVPLGVAADQAIASQPRNDVSVLEVSRTRAFSFQAVCAVSLAERCNVCYREEMKVISEILMCVLAVTRPQWLGYSSSEGEMESLLTSCTLW
jgi:hypothetical protein